MKFCLGKLSEAQKYTLIKLVVKIEEVVNVQHVSLKAIVSQFPFTFFSLSGFSILLNDMSSQGVFSKAIYHGTVMIYGTKPLLCTGRATCTYYVRTT